MKEKTTIFEAVKDEDVINKAYLDENSIKRDDHLLFGEKDYNELKLQYDKQSVGEILIQTAVKTTIQIRLNKYEMIKDYVIIFKTLKRF